MTTNGQPIKSGIFIMPFHPPEKPLAQGYDEDIELAVLADELGFDEFWIGEHHTMRYETIVVPEVFIGRSAGGDQAYSLRTGSDLRQSASSGLSGHAACFSRSLGPWAAQSLLRTKRREYGL